MRSTTCWPAPSAPHVPARDVGEVGGADLAIAYDGGRLALPVADLHRAWSEALPRALGE